MTVSYMHKVGTVGKVSSFTTSVLFRWHGGLFQAAYTNLLLYCLAYFVLACIYIFILQEYDSLIHYRWWVSCKDNYISNLSAMTYNQILVFWNWGVPTLCRTVFSGVKLFKLQSLRAVRAPCWTADKRPLGNGPPHDRIFRVAALSALVVAIPG